MSKALSFNILAIGGALFGFSSGLLAQNIDALDKYSVVVEADDWAKKKQPVYGSIYKVYYNKSSNWGTVRYVRDGKNDTLFNFDSEGNIYVVNKEHSVRYTVHEPVLKDFARMAENLRTKDKVGHGLDEEEVRRITNKVNNLSNTIINPDLFKSSDLISSGPAPENDPVVPASAEGVFAFAAGQGANANGDLATAVGSWAAADGKQSTALGEGAYAYADASTAAGTAAYVDSSAIYGTAIGNRAKVDKNATEGVALGAKAISAHKNSVALGANARTTRDNEVYIGYEEASGKAYKTRTLGGLTDGTRPSDAATVRQVDRVKDSVDQLAKDTNIRIGVEAQKSREYTDSRTTVGINTDGTLTRAEGAKSTIGVNEGILILSGRTDKIDAAVAATDSKVESRTTVGVNSDGTLTSADGAKKTIAVNDGLVRLSGKTERIDAAVGSIDRRVSDVDNRVTGVDRRVTKNTQSIKNHSRQLQEHNTRLNNQQRQIRENHEEMKRAAAQSAALAGLFQPYSVGKFNATAALGGYSDKQAVAVGVGYRFNEQTAAKAGVATSDGDVSYNVGVNFEF